MKNFPHHDSLNEIQNCVLQILNPREQADSLRWEGEEGKETSTRSCLGFVGRSLRNTKVSNKKSKPRVVTMPLPAKPAWGKTVSPTVAVPSPPLSQGKPGRNAGLLDIMSEQLAQTLEEECNAPQHTPSKHPASNATIVDEVDVLMAGLEDYMPSPQNKNASVDMDFALAAQLQEEEDALRWKQERHGPTGNVTIQYFNTTPLSVHKLAELSEQLQSDDEDDEQCEKPKKKNPPWKVRNKSLKGQGGDAEIITKHDPTVNGHKNARRLERMVPNCGDLGDTLVPNRIYNSFQHRLRKQAHAEKGVVGRTVEADTTRSKTLDAKTRLTLHRLLDAGILDSVNYVVRTGKEGVIFHAVGPTECSKDMPGRAPFPSRSLMELDDKDDDDVDDEDESEYADDEFLREDIDENSTTEFAVKVYKTNLTEFSNRHEYVEGDHRFASLGQLSKQNKQKVVRVWAEKEMKNMTRIHRAGLPCPEPMRLIRNVLVMSFIGKDGWGAPQLADLDFGTSSSQAGKCFVQVLLLARALWDRCKLVHADLSEFNVLFQDGRCYVVDVGQAVERMHPNAAQFLRRDVYNVLTFFFNKCKRTGCGNSDEFVDMVCDWITTGPPNVDDDVDDQEWCIFAKGLGSWADYRLACKFGELLVHA